ncbi:MAG: hypothetical protein Q8P67_28760 [archaeon]|nr:hypothetical protein [archaeon]
MANLEKPQRTLIPIAKPLINHAAAFEKPKTKKELAAEAKAQKEAAKRAEKERKVAEKQRKKDEAARKKGRGGAAGSQGPTNFSHDMHATWDPVNGFQIDNLPQTWKELFRKAGIKPSDLRDPKTSLFILETIAANVNTAGNKKAGASPSGSASASGSIPAAEPAFVPPPPPPPPPPGPPPPGAPPPPGPPPAATGPPAGGLANALASAQLKKVEKIEASGVLPALDNANQMENILRAAMQSRRGVMDDDSDGGSGDDDDDWSDVE